MVTEVGFEPTPLKRPEPNPDETYDGAPVLFSQSMELFSGRKMKADIGPCYVPPMYYMHSINILIVFTWCHQNFLVDTVFHLTLCNYLS